MAVSTYSAASKWAVLAIVLVANMGTTSAGSSLFKGQMLLMNSPVPQREESGATLLVLPADQRMQPMSLLQSLGRSLLASPRNIKSSTSTKNVVNKEFSSNFEESCVNGVCTTNKQSSGDPNMGDMNMGGMDMGGDMNMGGFDSDFFKGSSMFDQMKKPTKKTTTKKKAGRSDNNFVLMAADPEAMGEQMDESQLEELLDMVAENTQTAKQGRMLCRDKNGRKFACPGSPWDRRPNLAIRKVQKPKPKFLVVPVDQLLRGRANMFGDDPFFKTDMSTMPIGNFETSESSSKSWDTVETSFVDNRKKKKPQGKLIVIPMDQLRGRASSMFGKDPFFNTDMSMTGNSETSESINQSWNTEETTVIDNRKKPQGKLLLVPINL